MSEYDLCDWETLERHALLQSRLGTKLNIESELETCLNYFVFHFQVYDMQKREWHLLENVSLCNFNLPQK